MQQLLSSENRCSKSASPKFPSLAPCFSFADLFAGNLSNQIHANIKYLAQGLAKSTGRGEYLRNWKRLLWAIPLWAIVQSHSSICIALACLDDLQRCCRRAIGLTSGVRRRRIISAGRSLRSAMHACGTLEQVCMYKTGY